jgi:hypothetical protein
MFWHIQYNNQNLTKIFSSQTTTKLDTTTNPSLCLWSTIYIFCSHPFSLILTILHHHLPRCIHFDHEHLQNLYSHSAPFQNLIRASLPLLLPNLGPILFPHFITGLYQQSTPKFSGPSTNCGSDFPLPIHCNGFLQTVFLPWTQMPVNVHPITRSHRSVNRNIYTQILLNVNT